jgi:S1-C subfamily serine protease
MFSKIFFVIISLCIGTAIAQETGVHPSYVSIKMRTDALDADPITATVCGGVVADEKRRLVATAWHCVPNQRSVIEKPGIFSVGGMDAKLVTFSPEADTAIFQVDDLKGLKAPTFKTPKKGDVLVASAYYNAFPVTFASTDRFIPPMSVQVTLDWEGKVASVANANRLGGEHYDKVIPTQFKWIIVTGNTAPGFSGGPVFDTTGNFVGILSNINGGFTNVSSSENVAEMIKLIKE